MPLVFARRKRRESPYVLHHYLSHSLLDSPLVCRCGLVGGKEIQEPKGQMRIHHFLYGASALLFILAYLIGGYPEAQEMVILYGLVSLCFGGLFHTLR